MTDKKISPVEKLVSEAHGTLIGSALESLLEGVVGEKCGFVLVYRPMKVGAGITDLVSNGRDNAQVIGTLQVGIKMMEDRDRGQIRVGNEKERGGKGDATDSE